MHSKASLIESTQVVDVIEQLKADSHDVHLMHAVGSDSCVSTEIENFLSLRKPNFLMQSHVENAACLNEL